MRGNKVSIMTEQQFSRYAGFTFIEFLMGVGIAMILGLGSLNILYGAFNAWYKKAEHVRIHQSAFYALNLFNEDMNRMAYGGSITIDKVQQKISWPILLATGELRDVVYIIGPLYEFPNMDYPDTGGCLYRMERPLNDDHAIFYDLKDAVLAPVAGMGFEIKMNPDDGNQLGVEIQLDVLNSEGQLYCFQSGLLYQ